MADIGIERVFDLEAGVAHPIRLPRGMVALDGEREIAFGPEDRVAVVLEPDGPITVEIPRAMELAARSGLLEQAAAARLPRDSVSPVHAPRNSCMDTRPEAGRACPVAGFG